MERRVQRRKQLLYFGPLKVNSMQHGHDATAGNKLVTTLLCFYQSKRETGPLLRHSTPLISSRCLLKETDKDKRGQRCERQRGNTVEKNCIAKHILIQLLNLPQVGG